MKRPAFQFYPGDWRGNAKLRRCSTAARGAWMDVLCLLHDSDEYGVLRWPLADIANAAGVPVKLLRELVDKGVLKGSDRDCEGYSFAPSHAGKLGPAVMLVEPSREPCWFCSRFVRDEFIRQRRGSATRFESDNQPPKPGPKSAPKPRIGDPVGDGASSSSSSSKRTPTESYHPVGQADAGSVDSADRFGVFEGHDQPETTPNPVAAFAVALTRAGFAATSLNPDLIAYVGDGGTVEHLLQCASSCSGKPANYAIRFARRELTDKAQPITPGAARPSAGPSRQLTGVAGFLGANAHDLAHDLAQGLARPAAADLVHDADRGGAGEPLPPGPRRLSGR